MSRLMKPVSVTPSDTNRECAAMPDGTSAEYLYVGVSGDVALILSDNTPFTLTAAAGGGFLWVPQFRGILATGTTATGIAVTREQ